jgi:hypothetical protein
VISDRKYGAYGGRTLAALDVTSVALATIAESEGSRNSEGGNSGNSEETSEHCVLSERVRERV